MVTKSDLRFEKKLWIDRAQRLLVDIEMFTQQIKEALEQDRLFPMCQEDLENSVRALRDCKTAYNVLIEQERSQQRKHNKKDKPFPKVVENLGLCIDRLSDGTTRIELYPTTEKPDWVAVGVVCTVMGEGGELFTIDEILDRSVSLSTFEKKNREGKVVESYPHGLESFHKLIRVGIEV